MTETDYLAKKLDFKNTKYETPLEKTIRGIIHLPKNRQLFTLTQASDPQLIKGIAESTSHTEVNEAALAHKNYPHDKICGTKKKSWKESK
jgi:hypothetical protein